MGMVDRHFDVIDQSAFRDGMSRLGSSVSIVTTKSGGSLYGFTASAVCSVSDTPPTLLVCVKRSIACFHAFENARHFCVNTLMPGQEDISNLFGGRAQAEERFAHGEWLEGLTGAPVLANASVSFECELTNAVDEATHRVFFGRVIGIRENAEPGTLLYCSTSFGNLALTVAATLGLFFLVLTLLWKLCDRFNIAPHFRSAVVFCGTKKSLAAGVPMAHLIFAAHPAGLGLILLPIMIYHPLQLLICTPLANRWAREAQSDNAG